MPKRVAPRLEGALRADIEGKRRGGAGGGQYARQKCAPADG
jgi:hypothetical protein